MQTDFQPAPASKKMIWIGRIISALPILFMLFGVVYSFAKSDDAQKGLSKYGYPQQDFQPIVIAELICVLIYAIPQTSVLGAILLTGYLGGATATHIRVGEPFFMPILIAVLIWLGLLLRDRRLQTLLPLRR